MKKSNNLLAIVLAVAMIAVAVFWFMGDDLEHIEDTNGADNFSLQTITDGNIIDRDMGALNVSKHTGVLNDGVTFYSDKFTGVYQVFVTNYVFASDLYIDLAGFYVNSGNFKMAVVNDDEIIAVIEPDTFATCYLEDLTGTVSLVIAGESADFEFSLDKSFCEQYDIAIEE